MLVYEEVDPLFVVTESVSHRAVAESGLCRGLYRHISAPRVVSVELATVEAGLPQFFFGVAQPLGGHQTVSLTC